MCGGSRDVEILVKMATQPAKILAQALGKRKRYNLLYPVKSLDGSYSRGVILPFLLSQM